MDDRKAAVHSLRSVDWRYKRASELVASGKLASLRDDYAVRRAVDYLRQKAHPRHGACGDWVAIATADAIWRDVTAITKFAAEAYLICGADIAEVATQVGTEKSCIEWYALLFFDVVDRLTCPAYIESLIAQREERNLDPRDGRWKRIAYRVGRGAIEKIIRQASETPRSLLDRLRYAAATASLADGDLANPDQVARLIRALAEGPAADEGASGVDMTANIQAMIEALPWGRGPDNDPNSPMRIYDEAGIELHADEEMLVRAGFKLPHLVSLIEAAAKIPGWQKAGPEK